MILFNSNVAYSFVGGAHGGFHGGGYHAGHGGHHDEFGLIDLYILLAMLGCYLIFLAISKQFNRTRLGLKLKNYRQQSYLRKCKYPPLHPSRHYDQESLATAIATLKDTAMSKLQAIDLLADQCHERLVEKALTAFKQLQQGWTTRNKSLVLQACNNTLYSNKLRKQMDAMSVFEIANYIDQTKIFECHLVQCKTLKLSRLTVLSFIIKGEQIDEYTPIHASSTPALFKTKPFNCVLEVVAHSQSFKIYQVKIDTHVDDYVMKKLIKHKD